MFALRMQKPEDTPLNDTWTLYFHDPDDKNWGEESYKRVCNIHTLEDLAEVHHWIGKGFSKGMFFIMREHVFPDWNNEVNCKGGIMSIKILKDQLGLFWERVCVKLVGEVLMDGKRDIRDKVNGLSVSPKKHFCIVKVWLKDCDVTSSTDLDLIGESYYGNVIFKKHIEI
jgi:hypothetical protein